MTLLNVTLLALVAVFTYLFDQAVSAFNSSSVQDYGSIPFTADYAASLLVMAAFAQSLPGRKTWLMER